MQNETIGVVRSETIIIFMIGRLETCLLMISSKFEVKARGMICLAKWSFVGAIKAYNE